MIGVIILLKTSVLFPGVAVIPVASKRWLDSLRPAFTLIPLITPHFLMAVYSFGQLSNGCFKLDFFSCKSLGQLLSSCFLCSLLNELRFLMPSELITFQSTRCTFADNKYTIPLSSAFIIKPFAHWVNSEPFSYYIIEQGLNTHKYL